MGESIQISDSSHVAYFALKEPLTSNTNYTKIPIRKALGTKSLVAAVPKA